ncbi:MAG: biotin--acetyl-CoA-carboxylase ligase [Desulfovibrio sp.]|nr:biotin--acetyl-CoA-carboxylase ligase [Desulfovibrio sp.]
MNRPKACACAIEVLPSIWRFGTVTSCLDTAFHLAERHMLPPWGSVQAVQQSAGRGQLRRQWYSPPGNIYAAVRLPVHDPFNGSKAAPVVGIFMAEALCAEGWAVSLKWPNDLVFCPKDNAPVKVGGILLEERRNILLAGIGINVTWAPTLANMREQTSLGATCLGRWQRFGGLPVPTAEELWQCLVTRLYSAYTHLDECNRDWAKRAEAVLLWRDRQVELVDETGVIQGRLIGLGTGGGILLERVGLCEEFFHGSLYLSSR